MKTTTALLILNALFAGSAPRAAGPAPWWNPKWRLRTTISRPTPYRSDTPRPVEGAVDFPLLIERAGISGEFDPASLRVIERVGGGRGREVPFAQRIEFDATQGRERTYLAWIARPQSGQPGAYDVYFDTRDRGIQAPTYESALLTPENLLLNPGFEGKMTGWKVTPLELVSPGRFAHTTGQRSLKIVVDENAPDDARREIIISQEIDVRRFAGQEMVFECDLLAECAAYGAPVSIELEQLRNDGSRIPEYAVQPRWLSLELAQGQLVELSERGRFSPEAADLNVRVRVRCHARDADTRASLAGPESFFTVWLDRLVVRPGERWPWPPSSRAGFVEGALQGAPLNRGFEFTGQRRLAFNGASEGTLTSGRYNRNPKSVHWGLEVGTLEFWCRPSWDGDDGVERVFFEARAYGHRLQSRLRKLDGRGKNELEFTIADAGCTHRTARAPTSLKAGQWHHIAATWDFRGAHLQLFVNGERVGAAGPGNRPWPSSTVAEGGDKRGKGIGIMETDSRSLPMQAFIGGDHTWNKGRSAEAVLDELRISDVVRYTATFRPPRREFETDQYTRALFHFENERHGVHDSDDRFVRGHLACELPPENENALLDLLDRGEIRRRRLLVKPHVSSELFEANRAESRLVVTRPFRELPDPRFVEYRERRVERTVTGTGDEFMLQVAGDWDPLMRSVTFQRTGSSPAKTTFLPRWRANENVVPFSFEHLGATLAPEVASDPERAFEVFRYALATTNYYDAHYCETLPGGRHRPRVAYTLIKALNIYPFDQCGPMNHMLRKLFLAAGISSANASGTHHQFEQAFYDGSMRLFDLSSRVYWLNRDNATVLSRRGLEEDPYLKLRQGGDANAWLRGRKSRATFGSAERPHNMDFPLRPGERVSICWHNEGRWFEVTGDRKPIPLAKIPPYFGNGAVIYEPTSEGEAAVFDNMTVVTSDKRNVLLRAQDLARVAAFIYRARCPYILSGAWVRGTYAAEEAGAIRLSLSFDNGKSWKEVWRSPERTGEVAAGLLEHVTGRYAYWLKIEFSPGHTAAVRGLNVRTSFVVSPLALPGKLRLGKNRVRFVGGPPTVPVRTTCRWVERHRSGPGVSLNSISYYMNGDSARRNVFIASPERGSSIAVTLQGEHLRGGISVEGLPASWIGDSGTRTIELSHPDQPETVEFALRPRGATRGEIHGFKVVVRGNGDERRLPAQVLVADAALTREAECADQPVGNVGPVDLAEASGASVMVFTGSGKLGFDLDSPQEGEYALWLRSRWKPGASAHLTLRLDEGEARRLNAMGMIGFTDWTDPSRAHTKMFAHFGEQYGHWSWYRIPDVRLRAEQHRLTLGASQGACFDALILLPQDAVVDRAAMNLFQNWNYAPWENPW